MPRLSGVIAAAATPLRDDLSIDHAKLVAHCRWLLGDGGCDGVNLLGTTGEATSFSVEQRLAAMRAVAESGLPMQRFMVGTGASALADAVRLTAEAKALGFAGALLLPPFYYKGIDDESLVAYVDAVIERVGAEGLGLYLYHIPQNTGVPWPIEVVARLAERHPGPLLGLKDSSGDIAYSTDLAKRVPGIAVFPSSEATLGLAKARGFAGCISATTNVTGPLARIAWHQAGTPEAEAAVAAAGAVRAALSTVTLVAAVKDTVAEIHGDATWRRPHPPLRPLTEAERRTLREALAKTEYPTLFGR
ncbi:dihydrodipicolinate synthase family protein [Inquilinus sp. Marseille-Q2685]|uniref:dihydrodipicolinate synthase family protein n=1 Tax=Inquilinus sp. Marseille-Q2685 TaxID=2866581 RepID=UPI001CE4050C|nr:dihydrodipicolinate synthase family protein [Inquilinus sp. Marseille-Q2685]